MTAGTSGPLDFEPAALEAVLTRALPPGGRALSIARIGGGQSNPTYAVDWGGDRLVLRKQPAGPILRGAHAVDREFRVLEALHPTGVPVPRPVLFHGEPELLGTPFYLMERLEGRVFSDCSLPGLAPAERRAIYLAMADAMAALHAIDPGAVGLGDFGRPGDYFARQIARWTKQWRQSGHGPIPELDRLIDWLEANRPADDGRVAIAHGDFRIGNLMFHAEEPRVVAILDWELSTLGHPLADLGFACMTWRTTPEEYGGIRGLDLGALGIPSEAEFVARYFASAAPTAELRPVHVAFALFRFAVIFVGIADRARAGSAASAEAGELGHLAGRFAARGLEAAGAA
jgi:aminoglycoside phosphotransferase (APT) family kinase protein